MYHIFSIWSKRFLRHKTHHHWQALWLGTVFHLKRNFKKNANHRKMLSLWCIRNNADLLALAVLQKSSQTQQWNRQTMQLISTVQVKTIREISQTRQ